MQNHRLLLAINEPVNKSKRENAEGGAFDTTERIYAARSLAACLWVDMSCYYNCK